MHEQERPAVHAYDSCGNSHNTRSRAATSHERTCPRIIPQALERLYCHDHPCADAMHKSLCDVTTAQVLTMSQRIRV